MNFMFGLSRKTWNLVFIISFSVLIILCVTSLCINYWFKLDFINYYGVHTYTIEGGLFYPKNQLDNWKIMENECNNDLPDTPDYEYTYCNIYQNFYEGGIIYAIFTTITVFLILAVSLIHVLEFFGKYQQNEICAKISACCLIVALIVYAIGFCIWTIAVNIQSNCSNNFECCDEYDNPNSCLETGGIFAIILLILMALVSIIHCYILCKIENIDYQKYRLSRSLTK